MVNSLDPANLVTYKPQLSIRVRSLQAREIDPPLVFKKARPQSISLA